MRIIHPGVRQGFTFLEVMACLLVVGLGLSAVVSIVYFGMLNAEKAQGANTGMITAMTVAVDPTPFLPPETAPSWTYSTYVTATNAPATMDDTTNALSSSSQGFVNGYYVQRTESTIPADICATGAAVAPAVGVVVYVRSVNVNVDVFANMQGIKVASYHTRFLRQRGKP